MTPAIEARNLTKRYGDLVAVDDLSFTVERGEVWGLLGPNGAGKSTAIRLVTGLTRATSGEVLVEGEPIRGRARGARNLVGYCPQEIVVWEHLTVLENLRFVAQMYGLPRGEAERRSLDLVVGLRLEEKAGALAASLSGGMKRRLNLALALVHDPSIVVLDEPSAGLDPQSRIVVHDFIQDLGRRDGKTVILTTHEMDVADRLAHRVAIIDRGRLKVVDAPDRLKKTVGEGDTVVLRLRDPARAEEAAGAAGAVAGVRGALPVSRELHFHALDAVNVVREVYAALDARGIEVEDASMRKNTLEDVFIALTGRALREEPAR
ncbi:MAG TPA: ABC transporter ATP-binding protein [Candidatus Thermoplasmatota archaeon]